MEQTPAARFIDVLGRLGYKTQQQIADLLQIARPTAGTIVRQEREPSFADVGRLKAEHDEVNVDWIFTGKGEALSKHKPATAAPPAAETGPDTTPAAPARAANRGQVVEHADTVLKLASAEAENLQLRERLDDAKAEILWLRGKSPASSHAAAPANLPALPAPNAIGYHACAERRAAEFDEYVAVRQEEGGVAELV